MAAYDFGHYKKGLGDRLWSKLKKLKTRLI